ncbi:hypothetical protein B0H12DRAFT_1243392 [Mycena haematopus]|nr:hypothetical protein B0H12DRAFT_1243392 [Mycena haematopus]
MSCMPSLDIDLPLFYAIADRSYLRLQRRTPASINTRRGDLGIAISEGARSRGMGGVARYQFARRHSGRSGSKDKTRKGGDGASLAEQRPGRKKRKYEPPPALANANREERPEGARMRWLGRMETGRSGARDAEGGKQRKWRRTQAPKTSTGSIIRPRSSLLPLQLTARIVNLFFLVSIVNCPTGLFIAPLSTPQDSLVHVLICGEVRDFRFIL